MSYLYLVLALILPWLNGCVWLKYFESFFAPSTAVSRFRLAGYGFFAGYVLLSFIVVLYSSVSGGVSYLGVMSTLAVLTAAGALLLHRKSQRASPLPDSAVSSPAENTFGLTEWALLILAAWTLLHLSFSVLEIFLRPVYPWDAWLLWIYRAKAWFTLGAVFDFQNTADWLSATAPAYTVDALHYPLFASVIPFWAASSLGHWSETLINLPVALCGVAIALALYGQCREYGLSRGTALLSCYLLFSTPLFGTHLALAGYADIWMCGFAGLGFVSLIRGVISMSLKHSLIGLMMIAMSIMVKNEGLVWFLGSVLFLLILYLPWKTLLLTLAISAMLIVLALVFGIDVITIPLLGELSVIDDQVTLPFIETFTFQVFNVWKQYGISFFLSGSWNLTWLLLATCLVISASAAKERIHVVVATFIFVFLATQIAIFVFSSHGEFAILYTAINRLPLHFLPAILFSTVIVVQHKLKNAVEHPDESMAEAGHAA
jgi:hypothetical protein